MTVDAKRALMEALRLFRLYRDNQTIDNFKAYMSAFDRACGLTGWEDATVLSWLGANR